MSRLEQLQAKADAAAKAFNTELLRQFPPGAHVRFMIRSGQVKASTGTVAGPCHHLGYIRVQHDQAKPFSRYAYRSVHFKDLLP